MNVLIVNYNTGNLASLYNSFLKTATDRKKKINLSISNNPKEIEKADKLILPGVGAFDTQPLDSDNPQTVPDYIVMQRGAKDNNVWSRINFWYHRQNFLDVGDQLPPKSSRAVRPILEFKRDLELQNWGNSFITTVDIVADKPKEELEGYPFIMKLKLLVDKSNRILH